MRSLSSVVAANGLFLIHSLIVNDMLRVTCACYAGRLLFLIFEGVLLSSQTFDNVLFSSLFVCLFIL